VIIRFESPKTSKFQFEEAIFDEGAVRANIPYFLKNNRELVDECLRIGKLLQNIATENVIKSLTADC